MNVIQVQLQTDQRFIEFRFHTEFVSLNQSGNKLYELTDSHEGFTFPYILNVSVISIKPKKKKTS